MYAFALKKTLGIDIKVLLCLKKRYRKLASYLAKDANKTVLVMFVCSPDFLK